jgi:glutaredoxin
MKRSGMKTFPQIFQGERCIGGFSELSQLDSLDQLSSLKTS